MYQYLYLKLILVALGVWVLFFICNKNQRKEMLLMGLIFGIAGPIQELWYTKDYWHPSYVGYWPWIEDILFGFVFGGGASAIYEAFFSKKVQEQIKYKPHPILFLALVLMTFLGVGIFAPFMNSIYAATLSALMAWGLLMLVRHDLFLSSMCSGILILVMMFVGYELVLLFYPDLIRAWWDLSNISGLLILKIPLEEYMWFFSFALVIGPLYELLRGITFVKK